MEVCSFDLLAPSKPSLLCELTGSHWVGNIKTTRANKPTGRAGGIHFPGEDTAVEKWGELAEGGSQGNARKTAHGLMLIQD